MSIVLAEKEWVWAVFKTENYENHRFQPTHTILTPQTIRF